MHLVRRMAPPGSFFSSLARIIPVRAACDTTTAWYLSESLEGWMPSPFVTVCMMHEVCHVAGPEMENLGGMRSEVPI